MNSFQSSSASARPATDEASKDTRNASEHRQQDLDGICVTFGGEDSNEKKPNSRDEQDSREGPNDHQPYHVSYTLTRVPSDILLIFGRQVLEGSRGDVLPVICRHCLDCLGNEIPLDFVWKSSGRFSNDLLLVFGRKGSGCLSSDILLNLARKSLDCFSSDLLLERIRESPSCLSSDILLERIRESIDSFCKNSFPVLGESCSRVSLIFWDPFPLSGI
jgi:hypothetical protein